MKSYLTILTWLVTFVAILGLACEPAASVKTDTEEVGIAEVPAETVAEPVETPPETPTEPAPVAETPAETTTEPATVAEEPAEKAEEPVVAPEPPADAGKTEVAVIVNGVDITESDINAKIAPQLERMAKQQGRKMPPTFLEQYKAQLRQRILDDLIIEMLLDKKVKENNIVVIEDDVTNYINEMIAQQKMSLDDLKALLEARGTNFDEWKEQMQFPKRLGYQKLIEAQFADKVNITEEDARKYYSENTKQFEKPEQIKASHILIKPDTTDPNTDPNDAKAKAEAKAQDLLKQIKEGADFAELAKANSSCPSSEKGGDLEFFGRGQMVPAFEKTAFELEVGQISNIVQTRFGYHIIKVTDQKDASVTTFEEVKDDLINMLKQRKQSELTKEYVEKLKAKATIVYPPGKEPKPTPPPAFPGAPPQQQRR